MLFQSSKLKARTPVLPRFNEKRRSSFELWALKELSKMSPHVGQAVRMLAQGSVLQFECTGEPVRVARFLKYCNIYEHMHMWHEEFINDTIWLADARFTEIIKINNSQITLNEEAGRELRSTRAAGPYTSRATPGKWNSTHNKGPTVTHELRVLCRLSATALEWVMAHMTQSCHSYRWAMFDIWMIHVTFWIRILVIHVYKYIYMYEYMYRHR